MSDTTFRFDIELTPFQNPPGTMDRVREGLRAWIVARGLNYGMGALGGGRHCYGEIGPDPGATEQDREALGDWAKGQRIHAAVRIGELTPSDPPPNITAPIVGLVFEVDNLTEEDRAEAVEWHASLRTLLEAAVSPQNTP